MVRTPQARQNFTLILFLFFISLGGIIHIFKLNMWQNTFLEDWNLYKRLEVGVPEVQNFRVVSSQTQLILTVPLALGHTNPSDLFSYSKQNVVPRRLLVKCKCFGASWIDVGLNTLAQLC